MQAIAHLMSLAVKPNVLQRPASQVRVDPKRENALIRPTKLPGARKHATPVYPNRKMKGIAVLKREYFRGEFATTVQREGRRVREAFRDAFAGDTCDRNRIYFR